jgi:hypothetical protein
MVSFITEHNKSHGRISSEDNQMELLLGGWLGKLRSVYLLILLAPAVSCHLKRALS